MATAMLVRRQRPTVAAVSLTMRTIGRLPRHDSWGWSMNSPARTEVSPPPPSVVGGVAVAVAGAVVAPAVPVVGVDYLAAKAAPAPAPSPMITTTILPAGGGTTMVHGTYRVSTAVAIAVGGVNRIAIVLAMAHVTPPRSWMGLP